MYGKHSHKAWCITYIPQFAVVFNSYTTVVRDLLIYTPKTRGLQVYNMSKYQAAVIYHLGHTHLIGERTNENSPHLFNTVASEG